MKEMALSRCAFVCGIAGGYAAQAAALGQTLTAQPGDAQSLN
jgi:hypothetical protein